MFVKWKAKRLFDRIFGRPDIDKAYKMVGPEDSWYDTITTVHKSLTVIKTLPHESWQIQSHDGCTLHGLFYPCEGSTKTMIWVHGYTSHAERESAFPGLFYRSLGYNLLIPYLRAHGPSEGKYICFGEYEARDIEQWIARLNTRIPLGSIVIHGLSMGGGIVLELCTRDIPNVRGMIADAPNTNMRGIMYHFPVSLWKKDGEQVSGELHAIYQRIWGIDARDCDRIQKIADGKYPLLFSAGSKEKMEEAAEEIKRRNPQDTHVVILPGCDHGNGMYKQTELYQTAIRAFLEQYVER